MALQTEIWVASIQENLYPSSDFMNYSMDYSAYVNNATVHVPNAGVNPGVAKDRSVFPGTVGRRTDFDLTFDLFEYSTDPLHLQHSEELEVSYDKRTSFLYNMVQSLTETIGNNTAYAWSPSATTLGSTRIIRTTGALSTIALASGATGSRSAITLSDVARVKTILDNDGVGATDRYMLMPSSVYNNQFMLIPEVIEAQKFGSANLPSGVVAKVLGFNILERPTVSVYLTGATPVLQTVGDNGVPSASNVTDNLTAALVWHKSAVCIAKGGVTIFYKESDPIYYGDLFSALVRHGACKVRRDGKGVAAIVQQ